MDIDESPVTSTVTEIKLREKPDSTSGCLACGHDLWLSLLDGKNTRVISGVRRGGIWEQWEGHEVKAGDTEECPFCTKEAMKQRLAALPPQPVECFETREALREAHGGPQWHEEGPIYKFELPEGTRSFVQVYLGQHEWLAVNVDDIRDIREDPGWEATEFGWAFVPDHDLGMAMLHGPRGKELPTPIRKEGKPITVDQILFADKDKLNKYLGPDDPLVKRD